MTPSLSQRSRVRLLTDNSRATAASVSRSLAATSTLITNKRDHNTKHPTAQRRLVTKPLGD
jgi:hypothetical protein